MYKGYFSLIICEGYLLLIIYIHKGYLLFITYDIYEGYLSLITIVLLFR